MHVYDRQSLGNDHSVQGFREAGPLAQPSNMQFSVPLVIAFALQIIVLLVAAFCFWWAPNFLGACRLKPYRLSLMGIGVNAEDALKASSKGFESKAVARKRLKADLKQTASEALAVQSTSICGHVMSLPVYQKAEVVVAYLSCLNLREVDTEAIIHDSLKTGKRVYVPVVKDNESNMDMLHLDSLDAVQEVPPFGIREPCLQYSDGSDRAELLKDGHMPDLVLVPGLGFDRSGRRLGRGGGYYDKFLEGLATKAVTDNVQKPFHVGLSFEQQLIDHVPTDDHDHEIDIVVTPQQVIWVNTSS